MTASLFTLPKAVRIKSSGVPHAGALLFFYATGTTTPKDVFADAGLSIPFSQPIQADSEGQFPPIYYDQSQTYKIKLTTSTGTQIDLVDPAVIGLLTEQSFLEVITPAFLSQLITLDYLAPILYPRTQAERDASITPSDYSKLPGDIRRYGAVSDGTIDCSTAWAATIAQATTSAADRASVYIPVTQQGFKCPTGAVATGAPFQIIGGVAYYSYLWTPNDIALLTIQNVQQLQGVHIQNVGFISTHSAPTKSILHFKNSSYNRVAGCLITGGFYGVRFEPTATAPTSCFGSSIEDSTIVGCIGANSWNIRAEANTNNLNLRNVTCGGTALGGGLYMIDSNCLNWNGGDCESVGGPVAVELDASSDLRPAHVITGVDFESCATSDSIIRIGNTASVRGVTIKSNAFLNTNSCAYLVNPVRSYQLTIEGNSANTATSSGFFIKPTGTTQVDFKIENNGWQSAYTPLTYSASMTPHLDVSDLFVTSITDSTAFTLNVPDGIKTPSKRFSVWFRNDSGGAHGTGTISAYKATTTFPAIGSGQRRRFEFEWDGTAWYETYRSPADVPS